MLHLSGPYSVASAATRSARFSTGRHTKSMAWAKVSRRSSASARARFRAGARSRSVSTRSRTGPTEHQYEAMPITKDENGLEVAGLKQRLVSLCIVWTSVTPSDRTRTQCLVQGRSDLLWQAPLRNQVTSPNAVNLRRFGAPMAMQPPFLSWSDQHGPAVDRLVGVRPERQSTSIG